ncbi:hypothetical protein chiPu_0027040 [Chiloscyllium punctatum]|uniref:SNF2 N-terminal domain-containing protein n=1 Tax=Chiloscyllium punctatum TaxID=137246 RepID=A0A401TKM1_CHIPU|nr:hypothetical protein [Chiloscyllium punctatum]
MLSPREGAGPRRVTRPCLNPVAGRAVGLRVRARAFGSAMAAQGRGAEPSSELSPRCLRRYQELLKRAKEEARSGELRQAVLVLREAQAVWPSSSKVSRRIERLEQALRDMEQEEEEEEFTALPGSDLLLYRPLYLRLYPHQRHGVAFLHRLHRDGRPGGILADDMGLGKTVQLIAFLSGMFDAELVRWCLLLLPSGLIRNWAAEFGRWTPGLRVRGQRRRRGGAWA